MSERYFIELFQPESHDELQSFHQQIIQTIHDQSEPFVDPLTGARYRSWVGLSFPLYAQLQRYVKPEISTDEAFQLNFAKQHPGLYIGNVVHCVSSVKSHLEAICMSEGFRLLNEGGCDISVIQPVPEGCSEVLFNRDRRLEKRSNRYKSKTPRTFTINSQTEPYNPPAIAEPLPAVSNISANGKRKPIHIGRRISDGVNDGWFTVYGLSRRSSTVPLIPTQNPLFYP